jgi:hypothetical protein
MTIYERLIAVMKDVGAVGKNETNVAQRFDFRGIDAVINAVSPAFIKNGVICVPNVLDKKYETIEIGAKRTSMGHAQVVVSYTFYGLEGDSVTATVAAESMDAGDKATAKAMSVALRTALLQTLALPTNEPDADASSYERSPKADKKAPEVTYTPEQIDLAIDALGQVADISDMEELKNFYAGAQQAGLLHVPASGTTLSAAISARKKELENI